MGNRLLKLGGNATGQSVGQEARLSQRKKQNLVKKSAPGRRQKREVDEKDCGLASPGREEKIV